MGFLEGHVRPPEIGDSGDKWNEMKKSLVRQHELTLICWCILHRFHHIWEQDRPENNENEQIGSKGNLRGNIGQSEPAIMSASEDREDLCKKGQDGSPEGVVADGHQEGIVFLHPVHCRKEEIEYDIGNKNCGLDIPGPRQAVFV